MTFEQSLMLRKWVEIQRARWERISIAYENSIRKPEIQLAAFKKRSYVVTRGQSQIKKA